MEMEVVVPNYNMDFDFNSARSSPRHYLGSPGTPRRLGEFYTSAPTSPSRLAQFYREFDDFLISGAGGRDGSSVTVPFDWEEKPGTPKSPKSEDEFAFDVGGGDDWQTPSVSAEELFDGGVIRPLKPPPRLQLPPKARNNNGSSSSAQKISGSPKKMILGAFSPRNRTEYEILRSPEPEIARRRSPERQRGRERGPAGLSSSSRRATRSLSPLRVSQYPWEEEQSQAGGNSTSTTKTELSSSSIIVKPSSSSAISALASFSKKWRLKDFFLFRSASEGRASDKDPLRKYTAVFKRYEDIKLSSNSGRNINSSPVSPRRGKKGHVSAHELHYTMNKAVSDDMKKKTFLPYKQGILGRLAFNPSVNALANGFGLSRK
ncbi:OLC1v1017790C1 [Oldenlandia corymbosa var. corymbosa]|uniref:OLC1v1017790C1 n=1 Tax=Oldenlandia corymbosa var. corymbosa TaxID=529605 RepID=A0AAV1EA81_OLDCO|nr:OLC1v1017790C1 [Oldenlandia corymbosa var. corymbosa]